LRQKHRAEFSGANQADGHRPAGGFALEKEGMQIHGAILYNSYYVAIRVPGAAQHEAR